MGRRLGQTPGANPVEGQLVAKPGFRDDLHRAREVRGDFSFGEQILNIVDDVSDDWKTAANGRTVPNEELVLRSKIRMEARQSI